MTADETPNVTPTPPVSKVESDNEMLQTLWDERNSSVGTATERRRVSNILLKVAAALAATGLVSLILEFGWSATRDSIRETLDVTVLPIGTILPISATIDSRELPAGWEFCDGGESSEGIARPDLEQRFLVGTNDFKEIGTTGGTKGLSVQVLEKTSAGTGGNGNGVIKISQITDEDVVVESKHRERVNRNGVMLVDVDTRPPHFAVRFIIKVR